MKSCQGARSDLRRPKRYKNRGFQASEKFSQSFGRDPSEGPLWTKKGAGGGFSIGLGLLGSPWFLSFGLSRAGRRPESCENVSFLRVSCLVAFLGRLVFGQCGAKNGLRKLAKRFCVTKRCIFFFFEPCFGPFYGIPFFRVGFPAVRNAFLGPYTERKMPLWSSWSGPKIPALAFFGAFSLRCRAFCGGNSHSPCGFARWDSEMSLHAAGFNLMTYQPPGNCRNKRF